MTLDIRPGQVWVSPGFASRALSVTTKTLQRWGEAGHVTMIVLPTNRRRYLLADIEAIAEERKASW